MSDMSDNRISNLIHSQAPLSERLLIAKELAIEYGKDEDILWIDKELKGYNEDDEIPDYRKSYG